MAELTHYYQVHEYLDYDPDTGIMTWKKDKDRAKKGDVAGTLNSGGYLSMRFFGRVYPIHKLAWFYVYESWPSHIYHVNKIKTDNRINNLITLRDSW